MTSRILLLSLLTLFTAAAAWAQSDHEVRISCRFDLRRDKDRERFCTAKFTYFFNRGPAAAPDAPTYRVECDDETIFRGTFRELSTTQSPNGEPGMTIVNADRGDGFPVVYIDGLPRRDGFEWAPADLLVDRDARLLHGVCKRL